MASYEQNQKNKKWSVRFRCIVDGKEVNKRLSGYRTKKEAQAAYIEFESKQKELESKNNTNSPEDILFADLANQYLAHQKTRIKESSYITISSKINSHIIPCFKDKKISEITPLLVLEWQHSVNHYAYKHKTSLRNLLSAIYKYGERYLDIKNIMLKVEQFRNTEVEDEFAYWDYSEYKKFIETCDEPVFYQLFSFLYETGCRKGEALALTWSDFDFNKQTVKITKNLTRKTSEGSYKIVSPKNKSSNRTIDLSKRLCTIMEEYKKQYNKGSFVFGGELPLADKTVTRRFDFFAEKAGVKKIRIHDLRHSCASLLISEGISVVAVSKRLGHKDVKQTLNTYAHLMPNESERMTKIFEKI